MPDSEHLSAKTRLIFDPTELNYDFGSNHPLQARRLVALLDLLESTGLWQHNSVQNLPLRPANLAELELIHTPDYIAAVQRLSTPETTAMSEEERKERAALVLRYGFGDGDTPALPRMHEVTARIAGGTLIALSAVMGLPEGGMFATEEERPLHVFHPAGGLHHAWAERASGFCVYNDISVAIAHILQATDAKVAYLDFDAHHGDGVQRSFYDEPRVMTISLHETGRYLFPGTGEVLELGRGTGRGYSVNVPLEPFTEDDSYIEVIESLLHPLLTSFAPDVIISQHGCDTHAWDPLTHLKLTLRGIQAQIKMAHQLAHTYCQGRWVAIGGGGYDLFRVVPRAWSLLWAEMSGQPLPVKLPEQWIHRWRPAWLEVEEQEGEAQELMGKFSATTDFPVLFQDTAADFPAQPRRWEIRRANQHTVSLVRHLLLSPPLRQAFPPIRARSPLTGLFDLLHVQGAAAPSRSQKFETARGPLLMRNFCPLSFVERLRADDGLRAFARLPEREHQLLIGIAKAPDCALTLAYTPGGEIVGEVTLAPADSWWEGLDTIYEVAIEVSSHWRGEGIARRLLAFALELDALEDMILFAEGLSWHWDIEGTGLSLRHYREMLAHLFASQGFKEYPTTEPNVSMEAANILLVRIGSRVDQHAVNQFFQRTLQILKMAEL